jgi:hypothetical protein
VRIFREDSIEFIKHIAEYQRAKGTECKALELKRLDRN